jgi:SulP family sulfate permease
MSQRLGSGAFNWVRESPVQLGVAMRRAWKRGYDKAAFRADVLAGIVVGIVALPLSMALSIAVGLPPQHGLYTAIVAGIVVPLTGGSKFQITGPTAAFVVILAPIVTKHGLNGLLTAGLMAGVFLLVMGLMRLGRLIQYIPHPVTTGFTAGIAVVIATLQLKDALGLKVAKMPDSYVEKVAALWEARDTASPRELAVALTTLLLLVYVPKVLKRVPAPLVAITIVTLGTVVLHRLFPSFEVATIKTRFGGIPATPPMPMLPWGQGQLSMQYLRELAPSAFAIAMLGAIESLLSAVIADGMTGTRHDPNAELLGLGLGNVTAPFFGGIAATGALARTATNVRSGARSPIASVVHATLVLLAMVALAPLVSYIPMAALAGLLLLVAWNMSEIRHLVKMTKVAPRSDVAVLFTCFGLTVVFDMVVSVGVGVVLAALMFMRRMADLTHARSVLERAKHEIERDVPEGIALYEIAGPLFFGAAQKAMEVIEAAHQNVRIVVLDLGRVPAIDATGLAALESAVERLYKQKRRVLLAGPLPEPRGVFDKSEIAKRAYILEDRQKALELALDLVEVAPGSQGPPSRSRIPAKPSAEPATPMPKPPKVPKD